MAYGVENIQLSYNCRAHHPFQTSCGTPQAQQINRASSGQAPASASDLSRHPDRVVVVLLVPMRTPLFQRQAGYPCRHERIQPVMPGSWDRPFKCWIQLARFPSRPRGDCTELISVASFGRLVLARGQQFADDGERVHLNNFGRKFAPQARKQFEAEDIQILLACGRVATLPPQLKDGGAAGASTAIRSTFQAILFAM